MARKKKSYLQKLLIWGGAIIACQTGILIYSRSSAVGGVEDFNIIIDKKLAEENIDDRTKIIIKLDLALLNYKTRNKRFPSFLEELVPEFIKSIPIDPSTGQPVDYSLNGENYFIGKNGITPTDSGTKTLAKPIQTQEELIASLDADTSASYVYESKDKRDPFRSIDLAPKKAIIVGSTDLEKVDYDKLKLSGVILGFNPPKAIVEANGKGHTVTLNTKIGMYGGKIVKIESDKVTILESITDFSGEKKNKTIELKIKP